MECSRDGCLQVPVCRIVLLLYADPVEVMGTTQSDFAMCRVHGGEMLANLAPLLNAFDWEKLESDFQANGHRPPIKMLTKAKLEFFE